MQRSLSILAAAAIAAMTVGAPALAQDGGFFSRKSDGDFMVRLRGIAVVPDEGAEIGGVPGADVSIDTAIVPELDFTYFFTPS